MKRTAHAKWAGDLKGGSGAISTASGTLSQTPYSFRTRFEDGKGTNPEELLAAAHAGCFTMALSLQLSLVGFKAESLETDCTITMEQRTERLPSPRAISSSKRGFPELPRKPFKPRHKPPNPAALSPSSSTPPLPSTLVWKIDRTWSVAGSGPNLDCVRRLVRERAWSKAILIPRP